ncbi:thioredoxin family protein [uncultured Desulfovibrio sp.]|jgi:small redox-active disulfide protein 2|uniref:thioredoxin family protein n=1 Tax=uncultured Desulfovibrio sp. TaxID=167968 RepID=UPI002611C7AA|nr:thioredoxin family protein [uncultured Desulfovibrio sp.]
MEIKVFGPGCAKCTETDNLVRQVVADRGGHITVQKVSDLREMLAAGILSTPAVAIDGVVKVTGRVPGQEEVAAWIDGAASGSDGCGCGTCGCKGKS